MVEGGYEKSEKIIRFVPALKMRESGFLREQYEPTLFAIRNLIKDLKLALDLYRRAHAEVPLTLETRALFEAITPGSNNLDISAILKRYTTSEEPGTAQRSQQLPKFFYRQARSSKNRL